MIQLQKQTDSASERFRKLRLKINPLKTITVMFGRTKLLRILKLKIDGTAIVWSNKTEYLGTVDQEDLVCEAYHKNQATGHENKQYALPSGQQKQPNIYSHNNFENVHCTSHSFLLTLT